MHRMINMDNEIRRKQSGNVIFMIVLLNESIKRLPNNGCLLHWFGIYGLIVEVWTMSSSFEYQVAR